MDKVKKTPINFRISSDALEVLDRLCRAHRLRRSAVVEIMIWSYERKPLELPSRGAEPTR